MNRRLGDVAYRVSYTACGSGYNTAQWDWFETEDAALIAAKIFAGDFNVTVRIEEVRVIHEITPRIR